MRVFVPIAVATLALSACGAGHTSAPATIEKQADETSGAAPLAVAENSPGGPDEFVVRKSDAAKVADPTPSKIKPTRTEAALKFTVLDKDTGPIGGIIVSLTAADGRKYYTEETDPNGYAEVLVPVGQRYELVYLSLGRRDIAAAVAVTDEPNQNVRLTLRYKRHNSPVAPAATPAAEAEAPRFVLGGVTFDVGKATVRPESFPRLDSVVEYMTHKKSARIEISGHTDNVGNAKTNKALSAKRAEACRDYLTSRGVEGARIDAVGYGDERPIAPNDTEEGRQQNRRIEATEL